MEKKKIKIIIIAAIVIIAGAVAYFATKDKEAVVEPTVPVVVEEVIEAVVE
jgi:flagellar basal body-associated protein FliL